MRTRLPLFAGLFAAAACAPEEPQVEPADAPVLLETAGAETAPSAAAYRGAGLARQVCAQCHHVTGGDAPAHVSAESFIDIANRDEVTEASLRAWLTTETHQSMPAYILDEQSVSDLTAYILSLRGRG